MRNIQILPSLALMLSCAIGAPSSAAERDMALAVAAVEQLTSVLALDSGQPPPPQDATASVSEQAVGSALLQTPVAWLVMGDSWKEATPTQKREAVGNLRKYWTKMLVGVYAYFPNRDQRRTKIQPPMVYELSSADNTSRGRRLGALCSYIKLQKDCHSVTVRALVGPQTANAPPVEIVFELMPSGGALPYQVIDADILGISVTDSLSKQLQGKPITEVLALLQRAAAPRK